MEAACASNTQARAGATLPTREAGTAEATEGAEEAVAADDAEASAKAAETVQTTVSARGQRPPRLVLPTQVDAADDGDDDGPRAIASSAVGATVAAPRRQSSAATRA
eukprot:3587304-Prymnesium_polylepis.1